MFDRKELAKKHGSSAVMQGKINDEWVLFWVWKWGWTSNQIIQRLLQVARSRPADDFVKKGLLYKVEAPAGHPEAHAYLLSEKGYIRASLMAEMNDPSRSKHYTLHTSKRVPWSINSHNLLCQHVALDLLGDVDKTRPPDQFDFERLVTDLELKADPSQKQSSVADFVVLLVQESGEVSQFFVEIETNQKTNTKLNKWLIPRVNAANKYAIGQSESGDGYDTSFLILSPFMAVVKSYSEALQNKIFHTRNQGGRDYLDKSRTPVTLKGHNILLGQLERDKERRSGGFRFTGWAETAWTQPTYTPKQKAAEDDDEQG